MLDLVGLFCDPKGTTAIRRVRSFTVSLQHVERTGDLYDRLDGDTRGERRVSSFL